MSTPILTQFKGSQFAVVTAWGAGAAISAVTNANPAVVTRTAHGFTDGDVVQISEVVGMTEVNGLVCIVNVLSSSTFELVGIDSSGYTAYGSAGVANEGEFSMWCELLVVVRLFGLARSVHFGHRGRQHVHGAPAGHRHGHRRAHRGGAHRGDQVGTVHRQATATS